jgi:rSAM/selenodomain-associated transferase 1
MSVVRLVIFTRYPEPGRAKTRLIPALGAEGAALLHRRLTDHTVAAARASGLAVEVRTTGAAPADFADWLGNDIAVVDQGDGDLGQRLFRAAAPEPVLFIGSDLPDLTADHLADAAQRLLTEPVVVGPAEDGGYWALGLTQPSAFLFTDMPWGTDQVLALTLERLREQGIVPRLLPTLADCDRPEDLARWPNLVAEWDRSERC